MNILLAHNQYQQPGGEDVVFRNELELLTAHGHKVVPYLLHNDAVKTMGFVQLGAKTIWNQDSWKELKATIRREKIDVCHFHNTMPLISPSAYYAARSEGVPVIQTLHNYRLVCPGSTLYRDGGVCETCLTKSFAWPAIVHSCYKQSRSATAMLTSMTALHRLAGTWNRAVSRYIVLNEFARSKFIESGLHPDKVVLKYNFLPKDPGVGRGAGRYVLFAGRLTPEKGIETLLEAWSRLRMNIPLKIVGSGPMAPRVLEATRQLSGVEWLGQISHERLQKLIGDASFLVFPSEWYEPGPMVLIESLAHGTPILAAKVGGIDTFVVHGKTGSLFQPGNADALVDKVTSAWSRLSSMAPTRRMAREHFEKNFSAAASYARLTEIYDSVRNHPESGERAVPTSFISPEVTVDQTSGH